MTPYLPQVDEPTSFEGTPPPAYSKGFSVKVQLLRLGVKTLVAFIALIGTFVLLSTYIQHSTSANCPDLERRFEADPLIAEPSSEVKLHIGEDLRKVKNKSPLDCLVERKEQTVNAMPPKGGSQLLVKGEQTIITCSTQTGKRIRRSPGCKCHCAC